VSVAHHALAFACGSEWLAGVVTRPAQPLRRGVLIAVGGPQYRVGSHRQFTLLANHLAQQGMAAMRFDYRGAGDSTGELATFEHVEPDLRAAADAFFEAVPELREIVIWGLCDAASAALFYAHKDARVTGLVLLNPWIRSTGSEARAYLKHYYWHRLWSAEPWRKLLRGELDLRGSAQSLAGNVRHAMVNGESRGACAPHPAADPKPLAARMAEGLSSFRGRVLLILSGNDLTAQEFMDVSGASRQWRRLLAAPRVSRRMLPEATHTFSSRAWRDRAASWTAEWMRSW